MSENQNPELTDSTKAGPQIAREVARRADELYHRREQRLHARTDRMFAALLALQWVAGIIAAVVISPQTWAGAVYQSHIHVWTAIALGGAIASFPIGLALLRPGQPSTRYVIAAAQMLASALLIHLSGGRIETHFHIFGSLAFLAFYRDWRVFIPATIVVALDHALRGMFWPQSVFGVLTASNWRWVEHAAWVLFEDLFLIHSCLRGAAEMRSIAQREARLELTNELIEARVEERTAELMASEARCRRATAEAENANVAKSSFLATMSHELRTPLNSVIGFSNLLRRNKGGHLQPNDLNFLERISRNGEHLLELINQVLDISKIESGRIEIAREPVDLAELTQQVVQLQSSIADERGISLQLHLPERIAPIVADRTRMLQVLTNLVGNAIKFTESGSVTLRVALDPDLHLPVQIDVVDTGIGIPAEKLTTIFDAFRQADDSTSREYGGTGLGLTISRELCQLMGFALTVESEVGSGSCFRVALEAPSVEVVEPGPDSATFARDLRLSGTDQEAVRVLVIDDESDARFLLADQLTELGCAVRTAGSGPEGIALAQRWRPQLITLDLMMPGMNGFAVLDELKSSEALRDTPVVVVSIVAGEWQAALVGSMAAMTKPVAKPELERILGRIRDDASSKTRTDPTPEPSNA